MSVMIASFNDFMVFCYKAVWRKCYSHGFCLLAVNENCKVLREVIVPHFDVCS